MSDFAHRRLRREGGSKKAPAAKRFGFLWILILVIVSYFIVTMIVRAVGNVEITPKIYTIGKGETLNSLYETLDLPVSKTRYKLWLKWYAPSDINLAIGQYQASSGTTLSDFLTKSLKNPLNTDMTITILPGWSTYDIDAYFASQNIVKSGEFIAYISDAKTLAFFQKKYNFLAEQTSLEGFLYPDTYRVRKEGDLENITDTLLREFQKRIGDSYMSMNAKTAYQNLILASIVEREDKNIANQPMVAGILARRFEEGIALGADATVCYGYARTQKDCTPSFIASVIAGDNLYNTRKKRGYTPTPIASVPEETWNATINRVKTEYLYYLHDNEGNIHYAVDNAGHVVNKQKYLR